MLLVILRSMRLLMGFVSVLGSCLLSMHLAPLHMLLTIRSMTNIRHLLYFFLLGLNLLKRRFTFCRRILRLGHLNPSSHLGCLLSVNLVYSIFLFERRCTMISKRRFMIRSKWLIYLLPQSWIRAMMRIWLFLWLDLLFNI